MSNTRKTAIVTGGSRNIGKETALELSKAQNDVIITYNKNKEMAEDVVREINQNGVQAAAIQLNLDNPDQTIDEFIQNVEEVLKGWNKEKIDILINNAGILKLGTFDKITPKELDAIYNVNYKGPFFITQKLIPLINNGGKIVNLGSGTARIAFAPLVSYGPLKAALQSLTLYLASFLGEREITVNAVAPGGLDDDFNAPLFEIMPQARDYIKSNTAVKKIGMPKDVSKVIAFLCSDDSNFVSGSIINIDGGYHL